MSNTFEEIKSSKKPKGREELWLLSYADLVTNLMAIFIMMFALSNVDKAKFDAVTSKMGKSKTPKLRTDTLDELQKKIDAEVKKRKLNNIITTNLSMSGLNVEFSNGVMFKSASSDLSRFAIDDAGPILKLLAKSDAKYSLSLEGHTDDVPLKNSKKFRDNWDLSSARGVALLNKLKELGTAETRMSVAGYSDTRPKIPVEKKSGIELEKARAANRRVVIRVYQ